MPITATPFEVSPEFKRKIRSLKLRRAINSAKNQLTSISVRVLVLWFSLTLYFLTHCAYQYQIWQEEKTQTQILLRIEALQTRERILPYDTIQEERNEN